MKIIRKFYITIALITLMIIRLFASGTWFASIVVCGLLVSWVDLISRVRKSYADINTDKGRVRYAITLSILSLFGAAFLILIIVNLALGIKWMNSPLLLDECTLFTLLICLCQDMIVNILYLIITR